MTRMSPDRQEMLSLSTPQGSDTAWQAKHYAVVTKRGSWPQLQDLGGSKERKATEYTRQVVE
jgi:hypothetical protein